MEELIARMPVPKLVCEVACASGFAWSMDDDVSWDTRSYVRKARSNSIALEKGEFRNTHACYVRLSGRKPLVFYLGIGLHFVFEVYF